jgi:hypothetical protein
MSDETSRTVMDDVSSPGAFPHADGVKAIARCILKTNDSRWAFAEEFADAIEDNWRRAKSGNPSFFNGVVYLVSQVTFSEDVLEARLLRTDFKSYLYWRSLGFPDAGVIDGFGSALIRSADDRVLLVTQRAGNVNHGFAYLPSGFIDQNDVRSDGTIDIGASVAREVTEELGEAANGLHRTDGYLVARSGAQLCFAVLFSSPLTADAFAEALARHNETSDDPELDSVVPVATREELGSLTILPYARLLAEAILPPR